MKYLIDFISKIIHIVFELLQYTVMLTAVLLIIMYLCGIHPYVVATGSMTPTIPEGSICFVNHNISYDSIVIGDIISFRIGEKTQVTHRVVRIDADGLVTQGDANKTEDTSKVVPNNYTGKTVWSVPKIGYIVKFMKSRTGKILAGTVFLILFVSVIFKK